jgi:hypothetical protein
VFVVFRARFTPNRHERLADKDFSTGFWVGRNATDADSWGAGCMQFTPPFGTFVALSDAAAHVLSVRRSGTDWTVRGDGATATASDTVSGAALSTVPLRLGAGHPNLNSNLGADIYEFALYDRAVTDLERTGLELGFGNRWSITVT